MKILAVSQHYYPEPFNISDICEELVHRGHDVTVLTGLPNYPEGTIQKDYRQGKRREETINGVSVRRTPIIARGKNLKGINKFRRVLNYLSFPISAKFTKCAEEKDYDLVICFQFSPVLMALPALRIAGKKRVPCLVYVFDLWPEDLLTGGISRKNIAYKSMRIISKKIYSSADAIAISSPGFLSYFETHLGLRDLKTFWLPQYAEKIFEELGDQHSKTEVSDTVTFTFAGNIGGNQSVKTIIQAASLLGESNISIKIAGSGSCYKECLDLASRLNARNVEFLGRLPLNAMPELYASSDAMLLTLAKAKGDSLVPIYTIPRKYQSYIAAGKPIICSADGEVANQVAERNCGISCEPENAESLAAAMRAFSSFSLEKRLNIGRAAKSTYERDYSRSRFFDRLENIMNSLVKERGC